MRVSNPKLLHRKTFYGEKSLRLDSYICFYEVEEYYNSDSGN